MPGEPAPGDLPLGGVAQPRPPRPDPEGAAARPAPAGGGPLDDPFGAAGVRNPGGTVVEPTEAELLALRRSRRELGPSDDPDRTDLLRPSVANDRPGWHVRLFGSREFFRLWLVMVVSSIGDWMGLAATIALATSLYPGNANAAAAAISLVVSIRLLPGFFFAPVAGVFVDRWDRRKVMVVCDLGRAGVLVLLPFVHTLWGLALASLVLEALTLLWTPAKDATTPNLVPPDHLATANSLSMAAAYGTFPVAQLLFAALAGISALVAGFDPLSFLGLNQTALAFYADALTFVFAAVMVWRMRLPRARPAGPSERLGPRAAFRRGWAELKEGWQYIFINPTVRAVNLGMAMALIGGGMLIPLGAIFATDVLGAGDAGYGLFTTALGLGVAAGVVGVSALERRLPEASVFSWALLVAGVSLFCAASSGSLAASTAFVFVLGTAVGPVYVLGLALIQQEVDDELRGRVLAGYNTLIRLCVFASITLGPLLVAFLGSLSDRLWGGTIDLGGLSLAVPGVRLTLWLASAIIVGAAFVARHSIRLGLRRDAAGRTGHPARYAPAGRVVHRPDLTVEHADFTVDHGDPTDTDPSESTS